MKCVFGYLLCLVQFVYMCSLRLLVLIIHMCSHRLVVVWRITLKVREVIHVDADFHQGADVKFHGTVWDEANELVLELSQKSGLFVSLSLYP